MRRGSVSFEELCRWGLLLIAAVALVLALLAALAGFEIDALRKPADHADAVLKYLGLALVALVLLRVGSLVKAKFAGTEIEFAAIVVNQSNDLTVESV
jgi:hypothetical protein